MSVIETMIDIPAEHEKNVCGQFDTYLKKIERTLHVTMIARDGEIKIIGPEQTIGQARSVFNNLIELSKRGNTITAVSYTHLDVYKRQDPAYEGRHGVCGNGRI